MADTDTEHLKLLSIFHYVAGGLTALVACIPVIHLALGIFFVVAAGGENPGKDAPPAFLGWLFIGFASFFILAGWALAACMIVAGRQLARRRRYLYCLVMACVECVFMPIGTVLGVFSIVVLSRASVKALFEPASGGAS